MAQKCPSCNSHQFYYVQTVREYHSFEHMPDEQGYTDLIALEDTVTVDSVEPHLKCNGCGAVFNLQGGAMNFEALVTKPKRRKKR